MYVAILAELAGGDAVEGPKPPGKGRGRREAAIQSDLGDGLGGVVEELGSGPLHSQAEDEVPDGLPHPPVKEAVEVIGREASHFGEGLKVHGFGEMGLDVVHNPIEPRGVFRAA
jgi:hypothetical protein